MHIKSVSVAVTLWAPQKLNKYFSTIQKLLFRDFPSGPVVKNPPSNAEDTGSILGRGTKIPHAAGQLNLHATTREPALCKY